MAAFSALTAEQQAVWHAFENMLRAWAGEQARANNHADAINTMYNAQIQALLVALDNNSIVPNTSGLDGSQSLDSDAETVTIVSHIQGILTNYNTAGHRQLWAKAAGAPNLIG
jgi:hypothetical protein